MAWRRKAALAALAGALSAGCGAGEPEPELAVEQAEEALEGAYYVGNVRAHPGSHYTVDPGSLLDAAEAWGPQTLLLSIDRSVAPQISIQRTPGAQLSKDKLTRTLQDAVGFSVTEGFEITASSSTVVDEGSYQRLEAYPTFQRITWDLWNDVYGAMSGAPGTPGTLYRPMGVYFRVVTLVKGPGKNDRPPPQPGSLTPIGKPVVSQEAIGLH